MPAQRFTNDPQYLGIYGENKIDVGKPKSPRFTGRQEHEEVGESYIKELSNLNPRGGELKRPF
jgi:hypothetical protein